MSPRFCAKEAGGGGLAIVLTGRLRMADQIWLIYLSWLEVWLPLPLFLCRALGRALGGRVLGDVAYVDGENSLSCRAVDEAGAS